MVGQFSGDLITSPIVLRELYDFINPSIEVRDYLFNFPKKEEGKKKNKFTPTIERIQERIKREIAFAK